MLRLGVTGGIGSGKSLVCSIFKFLGVPVYEADKKAKELIASQADLQNEIIKNFGEQAFVDGVYNKTYIAAQVFSDRKKLDLLNALVHPYVLNDWEEFCKQHRHEKYIVKEAAIMLETDSKNSIDRVVLVYAPQELRLARILKRDQASEEEVLARMSKQMPEEEKRKRADFIILNDGSKSLIQQVLDLHKTLTS